jgi:uncharacterized cupredoxin-like copper-binding protein
LKKVLFVLALLGLGAAGVAAPFAIPALGSRSSASSTVTIKVTATEYKFALSKRSVSTGTTVIFKVTNKGKVGHDFKINGKKTRLIQPGKTATLKVVFKKKGKYGYICTVLGHATLGMKGTLGVGVKVSTTTTTTRTTTTTGTTTTGTTTTTPTSCTTPTTTITVGMFEYRFDLSQSSVPAGCIQFVITNRGAETHNFDITGVKAGAILNPGGTETWAVQLTAGAKNYVCDVPFHADRGMVGSLTVT